MASILPMPDTFSSRARVTRKLFSSAKDHPPLPSRVSHRAAIDCSASGRKRQGIHPYAPALLRALSFTPIRNAPCAREREGLNYCSILTSRTVIVSIVSLSKGDLERKIWKETIELQLKWIDEEIGPA